jgi:hypothetical protein
MSLTQDIVDVIHQRGTGTLADLLEVFPEFTRQQVKQGLYNASFRGLVVRIKRGKALGRGNGSEQSVFGPAPPRERPKPAPVDHLRFASSVFDLGRLAPQG